MRAGGLITSALLALVTFALALPCIGAPVQTATVIQTISDTFNRPDSQDLGRTEDAGHYEWLKGDLRCNSKLESGALHLLCQSEPGDGCSIGGGLIPLDVDITATISSITGSSAGIIAYRQDPSKNGGKGLWGFGPSLFLYGNGAVITHAYYWYGTTYGKKNYIPPTLIDWSVPHTVRIRAESYHVQVWLDNVEIMNHYNRHNRGTLDTADEIPASGYISLARLADTGMKVDKLTIDVLQQAPPKPYDPEADALAR